MKKVLLMVGGVVVIAGAAAAVGVALHSHTKPASKSNTAASAANTNTVGAYKVVKACDAFTLADAKAVLGSGAKAGAGNGVGDAASADIAVSTCSYSGAGTSLADTKTITLLARSAKSAAGAASNKSVFGPSKPVGKQDVHGIGDQAFWDAQLSQLDVLVGNNWYIIGNMVGTHADSGTLVTSQAVYSQIQRKL